MKLRVSVLVSVVALLVMGGEAWAASKDKGMFVRLLVGRPEPGSAAAAATETPGTIVLPGGSGAAAATDLFRVMDELKATYRLASLEAVQSDVVRLEPGETKALPSVSGGPKAEGTLIAFDDRKATYRFRLTEGGQLLSEPTISVASGGRAILGGRDGAAAPYIFLIIEDLPTGPERREGFTEPKVVKRLNPQYPLEAKKAKLEGLVLLMCTIAVDGSVRHIEVSRGEPGGLTESAKDAVSQWQFEPPRDPAGKPVEVQATVAVRFKLS